MTKLILSLAAVAAVAAFGVRAGPPPAAIPAQAAPAPEQRQPAIEVFRLERAGTEVSCAIAKGEPLSPDTVAVAVEARCGAVHETLVRAKRWRDLADGTVMLTTAEGDVVARFAPSDGPAYESFDPAAPILSLTVAE